MPYHVYHLIDPRDKTVRYIGKSTSPKSRYRTHLQESLERQNTRKKAWIADLIIQGYKPVLAVVATFSDEPTARLRESQECHQHKATIFNIHDPAKGAKAMNLEKKKKEKS